MEQYINKVIISAILLAGFLATGNVQAATITWGPATNVVNDSDISTKGVLRYAEHWAGTEGTVNGVTFKVIKNVDKTNVASWEQGTLSKEYFDILRGVCFAAGPGTAVTLNSLEPGHNYQIQIWAMDKRYTTSQYQNISHGPSLSIGTGQYAIGTFTADSATQAIAMGYNSAGIIGAIQVRDVTPGIDGKTPPVPGKTVTFSLSAGSNTSGLWTLSDEKINVLRAGDVCEKIGLKEVASERKRFGVQNWTKPEQVFSWPVKATDGGSCEVTLLVKTPQAGTVMILSSNSDRVEIKSPEAGWQRIPANLKVATDDTIKLQLQNELPGGKEAAEIISLEVISPGHLPIHQARMAEIRTPVEDVQWFQNSGFGIMFQWGNWGYPQTGEKKQPWNKVYEDFNIEAFADKMKSMNPGYIIWSVSWRGSRFSAPLKSVETIMGSKDYTMEYDFLGKLTDALTKRGIPVFFYYHPGAEEPGYWNKVWRGHNEVENWEDVNVAIWTEIGERLGDKLSGWFVDDGMVQYYPSDFYRYIKALKAGNPKRITVFNPWIFPNVSPYEDVTMGENECPGTIQDGRLVSGPNKGLMPHTMKILDGPGWGIFKPNTQITNIQTSTDRVGKMQAEVDHAKKMKHPISFSILMYEDGTLGEGTEALLKQLKR